MRHLYAADFVVIRVVVLDHSFQQLLRQVLLWLIGGEAICDITGTYYSRRRYLDGLESPQACAHKEQLR